jgi:hypothetical protein
MEGSLNPRTGCDCGDCDTEPRCKSIPQIPTDSEHVTQSVKRKHDAYVVMSFTDRVFAFLRNQEEWDCYQPNDDAFLEAREIEGCIITW